MRPVLGSIQLKPTGHCACRRSGLDQSRLKTMRLQPTTSTSSSPFSARSERYRDMALALSSPQFIAPRFSVHSQRSPVASYISIGGQSPVTAYVMHLPEHIMTIGI